MRKLSIRDIIINIENGRSFEAEALDGSFYIKIEEYSPFIGLAVHEGHALREDLKNKILLSEQERWYEEDPATLTFIQSLPLVMASRDSRYEYDLNRPSDNAIYDIAWGKKVWTEELSGDQKEKSLEKHKQFYQVLHVLVETIEQKFGACCVFDVHSYNYRRWNREVPLFNVGIINIDVGKFKKTLGVFEKELKKVHLPEVANTTAFNDVFYGNGNILKYLTNQFKNTLVLALEVKKVYCNEETGDLYPSVIDNISKQLKKVFLATATQFSRLHTNLKVVKRSHLLSTGLDDALINVDKMVFLQVKGFEILNYVNPINLEIEKKKFFQSRFRVNPSFKYRSLIFDPFEFKRNLYQIPVEQINDKNIQSLYKDIIQAYTDKIDIIVNIGKEKFLYNSLRYFGEPDEKDLNNARFLLHCQETSAFENQPIFNDKQTAEALREMANDYGFECKVEISPNIVSKALVLNNRKMVKIKKGSFFNEMSLKALAHHEIGVHMVTTINARNQPLHLPRIGTPLNTLTQEGLAIMSEYLSGNISIKRLKELALRVLAIKQMLNGDEFRQVFSFLMDHGMDQEPAYYLTARIFRGGGFTKDYLYLKGLKSILIFSQKNKSFDNLLIGKMSLQYINIINEMVDRKVLLPPKYITKSFNLDGHNDPIISYIISGLK